MDETTHFGEMVEERGIDREWIARVLRDPTRTEEHDDGTRHFIRQIPEFDNRWLRVIVNINAKPPRCVTVFFDRRLRSSP